MLNASAEWTRRQLQDVAASLRFTQHRLAEIIQDLPEVSDAFNLLAELRLAAETVSADVLSDAIATLQTVATLSESELRSRFYWRNQLDAEEGGDDASQR